MRIGLIGAGCVGSVLATRLYDKTNSELCLIADGERRERLQKKGLKVNGVQYFIPVVTEESVKFDIVFVCVKNYQLDVACQLLKHWVDENTIIFPLLNGISPVATIRSHIPHNRVYYGYITKIDSYRSSGEFYYNIAGEVHFGDEKNDSIDESTATIKDLLTDAGFDTYIDPDMMRGIWRKWMLNIGANQVSALTEANYVQFGNIPEAKIILEYAMTELLQLAELEGVDLSKSDVDALVQYLTTYPYPKKTSMLQDILAKRKTEIEYISGDILNLCKKWDISCPVNETMFYLIRVKECAYLKTIQDH